MNSSKSTIHGAGPSGAVELNDGEVLGDDDGGGGGGDGDGDELEPELELPSDDDGGSWPFIALEDILSGLGVSGAVRLRCCELGGAVVDVAECVEPAELLRAAVDVEGAVWGTGDGAGVGAAV